MWDPETNRNVCNVASQRLETIDDVIDLQLQMDEALETLTDCDGRNPIRAFNDLYLQVTKDVKKNIIDGVYNDSCFMEVLDVEFAKLYFEALLGFSQDEVVPAAWTLLFEQRNDGETHTDFEGVILGVNAHINRDLTFALIKANGCSGEPVNWAERRQDYDNINEIFRTRLDPFVNQLVDSLSSRPWNLLWRIIDDCLGEVDEWAIYTAIVNSRRRAWDRAMAFRFKFEAGEVVEHSNRGNLALFLGRTVLGSHLFDSGLFPPVESRAIAPSVCVSPALQQLDEALPSAAEVVLGSDLLEMDVQGAKVTVHARNRGIDGRWEGEVDRIASLFACDWVAGVVDAESDSDVEVEKIKYDVEVLRSNFRETVS